MDVDDWAPDGTLRKESQSEAPHNKKRPWKSQGLGDLHEKASIRYSLGAVNFFGAPAFGPSSFVIPAGGVPSIFASLWVTPPQPEKQQDITIAKSKPQ